MSQYNSQKGTGSGRSRARGTTYSKSTKSSSNRSSSGTRATAGKNTKRNSSKRRGGPDYDFKKIAIGGVILIAAIACIVFLVKGMIGGKGEDNIETTMTEAETELQMEVTVDGVSITGMSREQAKMEILKKYPWAMKVSYNEDVYEVTDLMGVKVDALLEDIYGGTPKENYTLDTTGLEEAVLAEVTAMAARWDKTAKNGSISSYDAANDKFLFTGAEQGLLVNQEQLAEEINSAIKKKQFDITLTATADVVEPEFSEAVAKEKYKTISTFTTETTSNSKRNTNVDLSAKAINGLVLNPGEEFSFNKVVGERTEAKGYKGAAAYNNGEVVEEIGGGVCQTSSTLYNVVVRAGLKTTLRRSHTYEPSYVRPGMDATVSWGGPDYKFVNNSSAAIGIRASYYKQTLTISIYGVPVLEDGVKYTLESKRLKEIDSPAPTYEEEPTLEPGIEKVKSNGSKGSYWETRLIATKNGEVISQEVDHNTTYKGHAPVILRNTSGTVAATDPSSTIATVESSLAPEGAGDGFDTPVDNATMPEGPGSSAGSSGNSGGAQGPGMPGTTAASTPTTAAPRPTSAPAPTTAVQAPTTVAPTEAAPPPANGQEIQTIAPNPMT